jgi:hypothetical protein
MRPVRLFLIAAIIVGSATAAACGSRHVETAGGDVALADSTSVVVDNRRTTEMTIYVIEGGAARRRLGTVYAMSKTRIAIPRSVVGNGRTLQFLADPLAGRGNIISHEIFVSPGDQVGLTIVP